MYSDFRCSARQVASSKHKWLCFSITLPLALLALVLISASSVLPVGAAGKVLYVDAQAGPGGDGSSWTEAYATLQDALAAAQVGDEVWVAAGIYYPDAGGGQQDNNRSASFVIPSGVALYGGFAGDEGTLVERNWLRNVTVLSGDIDQNDITDSNGVVASANNLRGANSVHVIYLDGRTNAITGTTAIDGFVITAGQADADGESRVAGSQGGGLYCNSRGGGVCSPRVTNITFSGNAAAYAGGAMTNDGEGGGDSSPTLVNVIFSGNAAPWAGALFNDGLVGKSSPTLANVVFSGNAATTYAGGAIFNFGAGGDSSPTMINVTFNGNTAKTAGGAISSQGGSESGKSGKASPALTNAILWGNSAPSGAAIHMNNADLVLDASIVEGGSAALAQEGASAVTYTPSNREIDPLLVQPISPSSAPTSTGDLRLQPESPALDSGNNSAIPAGITTDLDNRQRIVNGTVDLGAFEFPELHLAGPTQLPGLIANVAATFQPVVHYGGYEKLAFSLAEAPENMTIDLSSGLIGWTPQEADEGKSFPVTVAVNDGSQFAETSFQVTVLDPIPVAVKIEDNVLTVDDPSTSLNGMTITQLEGDPILADLKLGRIDAEAAPARPERVALLSDVFVVRGSFDEDVEVRFPLTNLPANVSRGDVDLYAFIEALDVEGRFWAPVWMGIEYEETATGTTVVVALSGLEGMATWGYNTAPEAHSVDLDQPQGHSAARGIGLAAPAPQLVTCTERPTDKVHICATTGMTITIRGWGSTPTRWLGPQSNATGATKEQFVTWLLDARKWFSATHLGYDSTFNVAIEDMSDRPGTLGYVSSIEDRKTLHINSDNTLSASMLKGTAVHEYFHHAQGHPATRLDGRDLLIDGGTKRTWMIEGTARWFEDVLFDDLNTYIDKEQSGYRIAEVGISSDKGEQERRPYQRFSFFKLLTEKCPDFASKFRDGINVKLATDPSGIDNLTSLFGTSGFTCNFGDHLGTDYRSTLDAALVYYNYATQFENNISLLDANEPYTTPNLPFAFDRPYQDYNPRPATTVTEWISSTQQQHVLTAPTSIPAVGAISFIIPAITGTLPAGKVAELVVEAGGALTVSITSADSRFQGANKIGAALRPHTWFSTAQQSTYRYGFDGALPPLFVTLVNSSLRDEAQSVKVTLRLSDRRLSDLAITTPQSGASLSNRVITVTGTLSEAIGITTTTVTVLANGIAANMPVRPDGTFAAQVVLALGENIIKVQGFGSDAKPSTLEKMLTVNGVTNASGERNALIASRAVFVLRWDTAATDVDIYTTDKAGQSVWFKNLVVGPGILDFDERDGFGPEVISYRATDDAIYADGTFDVDIHFYDGSPDGSRPTHFMLDVILNETEANNRLVRQYKSVQSLVTSNPEQSRPEGTGDSRFNNILRVSCSPQRVCNLQTVDAPHLSPSGNSATP